MRIFIVAGMLCLASGIAGLIYFTSQPTEPLPPIEYGLSVFLDDNDSATHDLTHPLVSEGATLRMIEGSLTVEVVSETGAEAEPVNSQMTLFDKPTSGFPDGAPSGYLVIDLNLDGYDDIGVLKSWSSGFEHTLWEYFLADADAEEPFYSIGHFGRATTYPQRQQVMLLISYEPYVAHALYDFETNEMTRRFTRDERDGYDLLRFRGAAEQVHVGLAVKPGYTLIELDDLIRAGELDTLKVYATVREEQPFWGVPNASTAKVGTLSAGAVVRVVSNTLSGDWLVVAEADQMQDGSAFWVPKEAVTFDFNAGS